MSDLLRHTVATLAYRGGKAIRGTPESFGDFSGGTRTPRQILAHISDLLEWACVLARGEKTWKDSTPQAWSSEVQRFFEALGKFDGQLASQPLKCEPERVFQGPIADALTHVGQLTMLRRMAGVPMKSENYFIADIAEGRVGSEQAPPKREFD